MSSVVVSGLTKATVNKKEALRYMGYRGQVLDKHLEERIDGVIAACERDMSATYVWADFPIGAKECDGSGDSSVRIEGTSLTFRGSSIFKRLEQAKRCALFAVTLGVRSEQELVRLNATDATEALIFDAACSSLVECAAGIVQAEIDEEAHRLGLHTDGRYSPGYGDFSLDVQPAFLACLGAPHRLGLTVTANNLLIPTKSITAVVGMYEAKAP